jgi:hypothetical protein
MLPGGHGGRDDDAFVIDYDVSTDRSFVLGEVCPAALVEGLPDDPGLVSGVVHGPYSVLDEGPVLVHDGARCIDHCRSTSWTSTSTMDGSPRASRGSPGVLDSGVSPYLEDL